jgi:hypothetical protein
VYAYFLHLPVFTARARGPVVEETQVSGAGQDARQDVLGQPLLRMIYLVLAAGERVFEKPEAKGK